MWGQALEARCDRVAQISIDASEVDYCDGAGIGAAVGVTAPWVEEISGLKPEIANLLEPFADAKRKDEEQIASERINRRGALARQRSSWRETFRNKSPSWDRFWWSRLRFMRRPRELRWTDVWLTYERAGVQALVVVGLIAFLTGLIMAFQAAPPLREFGVDIYVVNLVSLAMLRELGPIMTAIVLAGRSGSAFAAEIGTMKVNEEINALTTMGLDPVRFLVAPRVLAGVLVTPVLTIYADLVGVGGGLA